MKSIPSLIGFLFSLTLCFKLDNRPLLDMASLVKEGYLLLLAALGRRVGERSASTIFCYDCNSAYDPRCGEEFDSFSLGIVNCSLRDPPEHLEPIEPTFCRVIKMEIYGKVRIVRQCGYIQEEKGDHACRRQTGNGDLFVTYCTCDTDLCNASGKIDHKTVLISMSILYGIFNFRCIQ